MTLETTVSKAVYTGNGATTEFPFSFKVWDEDQILVSVTDTQGYVQETGEYSVTLSVGGGTVFYLHDGAPLPSGWKLAITRDMPFTQEDDYITGTRFDPEVIETALDKATAERQQLREQLQRAVILPPTSDETPEDMAQELLRARDDVQDMRDDVQGMLAEVGTEIGNHTIVTAEGSTTARPLAERFADVMNVKDFGAKGDGVTDDSFAIQSAIIAGSRKTLYFPAGTYICKDVSIEDGYNSPLHAEGKIRIVGAGKNSTTIKFITREENTNRGQSLLSNGTGFETHDYDIEVSHLSFEGDWGRDGKSVADNWSEGPTLLNFFTTGSVNIHDCRFSWSRNMAVHTRYTDTSIVRDCEVYHTWADGICIHDAKQSFVVNNKVVGANDDSIAVVRLSGSVPIENRAVITGNLVIDSCGIKADGVTSVSITGNIITRAQGHGIAAGLIYLSGQIKNKKIGLSITGNIIDTVFESSTFGVVSQGATRRLVYIYTDTSSPDDVAGTPVSYGNEFFNISNNICVRTLDSIAKYSDYGFGVRYARTGVFNGNVADEFLTTPENGNVLMAGIVCRRSSYGFNIENNNLGKMYIGVLVSGLGNSTKYLSTCNNVISGNNFVGFTKYGVGFISVRGDARVTGNLFDGDPNNTHPDRNSNGSWKNADSNCAVYVPSSVVIESKQNSFKNVGSIYLGATDNIAESENTLNCDPQFLNVYDENNIGIGRILRSTAMSSAVIIYNSNPTSPDYMTVKNICLKISSNMPTQGKYLEGMFVEKALKSVSGNSIIIGWLRKNTGDSNILNEDWIEVKVSI